MRDRNEAPRRPVTSLRMPLFPIVSNANDEYGPGNPLSESMKSPASSTITGLEHSMPAWRALCRATAARLGDWISSRVHLKNFSPTPKCERMDLASSNLCLLDDAK